MLIDKLSPSMIKLALLGREHLAEQARGSFHGSINNSKSDMIISQMLPLSRSHYTAQNRQQYLAKNPTHHSAICSSDLEVGFIFAKR